MRMKTLLTLVAMLAACGGTDPVATNNDENPGANGANPNGSSPNGSANNTSPGGGANNTSPGGANNTNPNGTPNNTNPNGTPNNTGGPNNTNPGNNQSSSWQALVGNGDITADSSSFSIVTYDGTSVTSSAAQSFGTGKLAVAASGGLGFVVDIATGETLIVNPDGSTVDTIDLQVAEVDAAAASNGTLLAASGDMTSIAQYSGTGGGLGQQIPIAGLALSGDPLYIRNLTADGNLVAGVGVESSMFSSTPQVFVADASSSSMVQQVGVTGAMHIDHRGDGTFAVATQFDGIKVLRIDGALGWAADVTLVDRGLLNRAEVEGVVMADTNVGVAQTYKFGDGHVAYLFDADAGTAAPIDGFALPTVLTGGDASADGQYFFLGDYGIREQADWGVAVVDREGNMLGHVITDELQPPMSIAAFN